MSAKKDDRSGAVQVTSPPENLEELLNVSRFLEQHSAPASLLGPDGEQVPLPIEIYEVLKVVASAMTQGSSITIEPVEKRLTTQQAANLLGISRPTLVRLLEQREIPFERNGDSRHRRLRLQDVLEYRERIRADRGKRLDEITRQAYEDGLYDIDDSEFSAALAEARKEQ